MSDIESIKKMVRAVLQSSKQGVAVNKLQFEYRSLCGENIDLKKLGFKNLEDFLRSIPSVVRLDYNNGDLRCFAAVCSETAHIAQLVARQKSSKKSGGSQIVNCRMRRKASNPYMFHERPMSSLRQPSRGGFFRPAKGYLSHGGFRAFSASGDFRQVGHGFNPPVEHRLAVLQPAVKLSIPDRAKNVVIPQKSKENPLEQVSTSNCFESTLYDKTVLQGRLNQLLKRYSTGLWMSKLPAVFSEMFSEQLPPQVLKDLEKWTHICMVEKSSSITGDCLVYPPLPSSTTLRSSQSYSPAQNSINLSPISKLKSSQASTLNPLSTPSIFSVNPLTNPTNHLTTLEAPQKLCNSVAVTSSNGNAVMKNVNLRQNVLSPKSNPSGTNLCQTPSDLPPQKSTLSWNSVSSPPAESNSAVSADVYHRIRDLLSKYTNGLWVHALPKLFMDTYKVPFPEVLMDKLHHLPDLCTVEYPIPNGKKAILYTPMRVKLEETDSTGSRKSRSHHFPSGLEVIGPVVPSCLVHPTVQYPSVLIIDAKSSNAVTIRYIGDGYSNAQEAMEDAMLSFYKQNSNLKPLTNLVVGQLVAVKGDNGKEFTRAQVTEVTTNNIKVYYVDHGFSVETKRENLQELHHDFLSLPCQATNVRLAGLEEFTSHPTVISTLMKLAVGKILLMELLGPFHPNDLPEALLYDTSQDDDININSVCLKELQDKTMNNPLTVNSTYQGVCVTHVCADGIIVCQLPSRGTARLAKFLEEIKAFFISQMTSDYLVSKPFNGKMCLTSYKDKWCRAEITHLHGNRVIEVVLIDLGVPATVEVTELREIPPLFIRDFTLIPSQAIRCRLADVDVPEEDWSPDVVFWLKNAVLGVEDCKMKILKLEENKMGRLVHMYLFDGKDVHQSINQKISNPEVCKRLNTRKCDMATDHSASVRKLAESSPTNLHLQPCESSSTVTNSSMPPPLQLPVPGQNMDIYVPAACHPGYFVIQQWQELHKLVVLMGEMMLFYNRNATTTAMEIKKGDVYAVKIDKSWYRAVVKGILSNGLVSVYELDHGKHELIQRSLLQPLIEEFRQLPFQAITAKLAGVPNCKWSEEASMFFRSHVEKQGLVAQIESVEDETEVKKELWDCRLTVYLVDTKIEEKDVWIHSIMADIWNVPSSHVVSTHML
ncbi:tudor domain-containing protein 7A [Corythoichthys intestinalis]|uniref:tudor domain-containing protein 7A n=1 Tax=Corythoichthys intestinalis TaxID=161448 RepID=UPI0025A55152|nr:tudor domain-containing protein 7A [Corythoichthys intestinalis]